jgi:hypothetical protein
MDAPREAIARMPMHRNPDVCSHCGW